MLDINFSFDGLFKGCFPFRKKRKNNIADFIHSLKNHPKEMILQMLVQKMVNGINDVGILYKVEDNTHTLILFYGNYDPNRVNYLNSITIPIFINSHLSYILFIGKNKKKNKIKIDEELLEILKDYL